jgi:hypothetical protein
MPNKLINEKSPYLLQHADNPVDWYPWGAEAFEKARNENKPIFLSIGYSTCHWCHVMAHESFEDHEVARLMNEVFVSIKVDREERPDIDSIYMTVCQMLTGSGGWPLTIIMTPDKNPFFAATYIPRENRFGRIGMLDLIPRIQEVWKFRQNEIRESTQQIISALARASHTMPGEKLGQSLLYVSHAQLAQRFDRQHGGFGTAPKFPTPHNLSFLLRYWRCTGNDHTLSMVENTLKAIHQGGIYDHVGFGFHRYSTDSEWLLPHFEKMLYDQALLAIAYTEAYQATGKEEYAQTAQEIFSYVLRDLTAPDGSFYSAEDADSEGEEGKFYLWTEDEIRSILAKEEADVFIKVFNIKKGGNFLEEVTGRATGRNILYLERSIAEIAPFFHMSAEELKASLDTSRRKIFAVREKRIHPHRDDKILTDWNGLMIAALAKGAQAFDVPKYAEAACQALHFILDKLHTSNGRILHRYRDGEAAITANLDDYVFLIWGLLELYETNFETNLIQTALHLNDYLIKHFWDDKNGGFYFTPNYGEDLLVRKKDIYDGAVPSGNSIAMLNLLRLGRITANSNFEEKAEKIGMSFYNQVKDSPSAYPQLMVSLDFAIGPSYEVVIAGNSKAEDTRAMVKALRRQFVPNKVVLLRPTETGSPEIDRIAEFVKNHPSINGKATAYICQNYQCKLPTTDINKMLEMLNER